MFNTLVLKRTLLATVYTLFAILIYCVNAQAETTANQVVSVKMRVDRGDVINENNLMFIGYNNKKIPADMIVKLEDAAGKQALRTLRPGMHLRYTFIREMPMVAKNKKAKAIYNAPGIDLELEVQILQDGQKGDIVKAKNLKSGQTISVEVIGENRVKVN
jgi:flagella basal body P-ring formation protein FlgA